MAEEVTETLVSRRSKRSTAGNRMAVALAEMAMEEQSQDLEDDKDFTVEKFEEDAFESDFASTDEEAAQEEPEGGEKEVQDAEKKSRKIAKTRLERATAAAHERQKVTFDPTAHAPSTSKPKKPKRRVSLGVAINAETGEVIPDDSGTGATRKSKRGSTRLNTTETVKRALQEEAKKAQAPKKTKTETRALTQGELIARALDNEEGNIVEHRDYLLLEEEKRKKARVVRESVTGPLIRWVSKIEETKVKEVVQPPPPPPSQAQLPQYLYTYASHLAGLYAQNNGTPYPQYSSPYYNFQSTVASNASAGGTSIPAQTPASTATWPATNQGTTTAQSQQTESSSQKSSASTLLSPQAAQSTPSTPSSPIAKSSSTTAALLPESVAQPIQTPGASTSTIPTPSPSSQLPSSSAIPSVPISTSPATSVPGAAHNPYLSYSITSQLLASFQQQQQQQQQHQPQPQPQEIERVENVTKNYVVHELGQFENVPKPQWKDTMEVMFGDHVDWEDVKVYSGRMRPLGRSTRTCPITGLPAKYLDPRTGVPFADIKAYRTLTALLDHQYVWSEELGCYVGRETNRDKEKGTGKDPEAMDTS